MAERYEEIQGRRQPEWYATHDPDQHIGSGGGTAHALVKAWETLGRDLNFIDWLRSKPKAVIHAGGQSRRLPAYSAVGKALLPIPVEKGSVGQPFDQQLLDLQIEELHRLLDVAPHSYCLAILSGDALMRPRKLPRSLPLADVLALGFETSPEATTAFGAFFVRWGQGQEVDFVLQKPPLNELYRLAQSHRCLADAGVWLLSEKAVLALLAECGWDSLSQSFPTGPRLFDLYGDFGLSLGKNASRPRPSVSNLQAVVLPSGDQFFHFGTNRQLLDSVIRLQSQSAMTPSDLGFTTSSQRRLNQHPLDTVFEEIPDFASEAKVWIDNSFVPSGSTFAGNNILTNAPPCRFPFQIPRDVCIDFVPVGEEDWCLRITGFDDSFRGKLAHKDTLFLGKPFHEWCEERGLADFLIQNSDHDIFDFPVFPCSHLDQINWDSIAWFWDPSLSGREFWEGANRLSASEIPSQVNIERLATQRQKNRERTLETTLKNHTRSVFFSLDLERAARQMAKTPMSSTEHRVADSASPAQKLHHHMFRSALMEQRGEGQSSEWEAAAFQVLQDAILSSGYLQVHEPKASLLPDQIVVTRSPLRFDLAGGWTDTPPYSVLYGGRVVNVAVELNGQPPIQVFGRILPKNHIVLRSIDRGTEMTITDHEGLRATIGNLTEFSLAQAALVLAGFGSQFNSAAGPSLAAQLEAFGGGIELAMVAAVPKGSGLGTSSILSGAILANLSEICGHNWMNQEIFDRVIASEQMLTTGGGWQDQVGGILPGVKLVTSQPGLRQEITSLWLPEQAMASAISDGSALLYYTGITRVAKDVLKQIVRGMFLNSHHRLRILRQIGENTEATTEAFQTRSTEALGRAVRRSWELNQALDEGTNPPGVARLVDQVDDLVIGAKLLGAGGGGYLLLLAKDPEAGQRCRKILDESNQATGARFVDFSIAQRGLEVARS